MDGQAEENGGSELGHPGELEMRRQFPSSYQWDAFSLAGLMRPTVAPGFARFIEAQPFFFIATASAEGSCDCSFRGRDYGPDGQPLPALKVMSEQEIMFPDFSGNGLYNSLGNILTNPHIGMLFMDFQRQRRARVNGRASIRRADETIRAIWPLAQAAVSVEVEQVYGNCSARIPRMMMVPESDAPY